MISIIACIGKNNELGKDNDLIFHLKNDMKFFRKTTINHPVVMGLKTFESIGSKPLPKRQNYVATFKVDGLPDSITPITDLESFLKTAADSPDEIFVIGGATIYRLALPFASTLYLTEVDASRPADVFFPAFDKSAYSKEILQKGKENDLTYSIVKYIKN